MYLIGTFKVNHLRDAIKYGKLNISLCDFDGKGYSLHKRAYLDYDTAVMTIKLPENEYFGE